ncbi:MAG: hypothetical protein M4579_006634 [Chaenotheca gracillima]|nr:MAG: hypothetical protein M4579_006634 [Chaenotheca gracillima]
MASLTLEEEEPEEGSIVSKTFSIIRPFLQPGTKTTLESTARSILEILPESDSRSSDIKMFAQACIEIAEQIPYHHPSLIKLVDLLEDITPSPKFQFKQPQMQHNGRYIRHQDLKESLTDLFTGPDEGRPGAYISFHAFSAQLDERRIVSRTDPSWAIFTHRDAFEGRRHFDKREGDEEAYVLVAAQYILWDGHSLFRQILVLRQGDFDIDASDLRAWTPGPLYRGKPYLTVDRWHFWRDGYRAVAAEKKEERYSQECRDVATKAANLMEALEKSLTF